MASVKVKVKNGTLDVEFGWALLERVDNTLGKSIYAVAESLGNIQHARDVRMGFVRDFVGACLNVKPEDVGDFLGPQWFGTLMQLAGAFVEAVAETMPQAAAGDEGGAEGNVIESETSGHGQPLSLGSDATSSSGSHLGTSVRSELPGTSGSVDGTGASAT